MSILDKAKAVTDNAAQRAAELKGHAAGLASNVAEKASSLTDQTTELASDLRSRAGALSSSLADAAIERAKSTLGELNGALPILRQAGYTVNEVAVELGIPPKIVASFASTETIADEQIETLLAEHADAKLATMLVHALVRAHKLQSAVNIGGLHAKGIALEIGLTPSVVVKFGK